MCNSTKHTLHKKDIVRARTMRRTMQRTKKTQRGGDRNVTKKQINMVFENMDTTSTGPKFNVRIQVYSDTPIPKSALDFDALSQLFGSYIADVDEQISIIKDGPIGPPRKERIINIKATDGNKHVTKKQVRILFENRHTSNKKYNIRVQVYSDTFTPKSAYDMNTISKLTDYYMTTIDEQLSLMRDDTKKGTKKGTKKDIRKIIITAKDKDTGEI